MKLTPCSSPTWWCLTAGWGGELKHFLMNRLKMYDTLSKNFMIFHQWFSKSTLTTPPYSWEIFSISWFHLIHDLSFEFFRITFLIRLLLTPPVILTLLVVQHFFVIFVDFHMFLYWLIFWFLLAHLSVFNQLTLAPTKTAVTLGHLLLLLLLWPCCVGQFISFQNHIFEFCLQKT